MDSLVSRAEDFATRAHDGQTEKDENKTPYIYHPAMVARLVSQAGCSDEEIAAAWLHDTVEDTNVVIETIKKEFGNEVAHIVEGLTDIPGWENLPVSERKQRQADRVLTERDSVKKVKLADQVSAVSLDSANTLLDKQHRIEYVEGCKKIADNCAGLNDFLDNKFQEVYLQAKELLAY